MTETQKVFTEIFTVIPDSKSKIKSSSYLESGKYAVVDQGKELIAGYTNTPPTVDENSLPVIVFGDHTRAVKYVDFPFTAGADGTQILKPSSLTNAKYGFYLVLHAVGQIPSKGYARHFGELKKMKFPLPSLEKQREIVEKLDSAFTEIDLLERNLGLSDEKVNQLQQSLLNASFAPAEAKLEPGNLSANQELAMKLVPLGTVAEVIAGQSPEGIYYNKNSKGTPFYQGKKEFGGRYLDEPTTWTTKVTKLATPGDILMSVRAPVGPINFTSHQICIGRGLAAIRSSESINNNFLFYFLLHKQPEISGNTGAVFDSINKDQIASIEIPLPSLEKQREIVEKLDIAFAEIEALRSQIKTRNGYASALRQSLLNSAFTQEEDVA